LEKSLAPTRVARQNIISTSSQEVSSTSPEPRGRHFIPRSVLTQYKIDGVIIVRNVCGHVAPVLNDIIALDWLVTLKEILIVHHTGT
jgi:hypothetical protein